MQHTCSSTTTHAHAHTHTRTHPACLPAFLPAPFSPPFASPWLLGCLEGPGVLARCGSCSHQHLPDRARARADTKISRNFGQNHWRAPPATPPGPLAHSPATGTALGYGFGGGPNIPINDGFGALPDDTPGTAEEKPCWCQIDPPRDWPYAEYGLWKPKPGCYRSRLVRLITYENPPCIATIHPYPGSLFARTKFFIRTAVTHG